MGTIVIDRIDRLDTSAIQHWVDESLYEGHRFLKRLKEEYEVGKNRFDGFGEALFVANMNNTIVGVCGLNVDPYAGPTDVGRVRHLYVDQNQRNQGIARQLVDSLIRCAVQHYRFVTLRTDNPVADRLYRSIGFSHNPPFEQATHFMDLTKDKKVSTLE